MLVKSNRGQITLPAATRNRLGIKSGDIVILEDRGNELVVKPAVVLQVDVYSDEEIAAWDAADRLDDDERKRIVDAAMRLSRRIGQSSRQRWVVAQRIC